MTAAAGPGERRRFTRASPCPACGGYDGQPRGRGIRCSGYRLGDRGFYCAREQSDTAHPSEPALWWHRANGSAPPPRSKSAQPKPWTFPDSEVAAVHSYTDEVQVVRFTAASRERGRPKVMPRHRGVDGRWFCGLGPHRSDELPLYREAEAIVALTAGNILYLVEGEGDADAIVRAGAVAATNISGARKFRARHAKTLASVESCSRLLIVADRDEDGARHAGQVRERLLAAGVSEERIAVVEATQGHDARDHLEAGLGLADLRIVHDGSSRTEAQQLLEEAMRLSPQQRAANLIAELARLSPLEYEQRRKSAARQLEMRVSALDREVANRRQQQRGPRDEDDESELYVIRDGCIQKRKSTRSAFHDLLAGLGDTSHAPLCNFSARIVGEEIVDDGVEPITHYRIAGELATGEPLATIDVPADRFSFMLWTSGWGARAVVYAGAAVRDDLRAAIQILSGNVTRTTVYAHLGWRRIGEECVYLHAGGAIGEAGPVAGVNVALPDALARFELPAAPEGEALHEAVRASLELLVKVAPLRVTAPLHAAVWRAPLGGADLTVHLAGPTGALKTALAAVVQQHNGAGLDAGHLPGNWSSTGNALEGLLFSAKDALCTLDDFAPHGTTVDVQRLHREADRVLRNVGNRAGRGRMRADGSLRPTKPPRALPLTTGEDTPAGQSLRARLLVLEVSKGDVDAGLLADLQAAAGKGLLAQAMAGYVRWLAPQLEAVQKELRETALAWRERSLAHRRTADLLGSLAAAHGIFRRFAVEVGALTQAEADELGQRVDAALLEAGGAQAVLQRSEDPVTRFLDLLRGCLSSGRAHLIALDGEDPAPAEPEHWGWRMIPPPPYEGNPEKAPGPRFAPLGDRIGWIDGADLLPGSRGGLRSRAEPRREADRDLGGQGPDALEAPGRTRAHRLPGSRALHHQDHGLGEAEAGAPPAGGDPVPHDRPSRRGPLGWTAFGAGRRRSGPRRGRKRA